MDIEDIFKLAILFEDSDNGRCSSCCRNFNVLEEFESEKEFREYQLSGLCKSCQDNLFKIR